MDGEKLVAAVSIEYTNQLQYIELLTVAIGNSTCACFSLCTCVTVAACSRAQMILG